MSAEYVEQIDIADRAIGILLQQLDEAKLLDRYFVLVQSDHGGPVDSSRREHQAAR